MKKVLKVVIPLIAISSLTLLIVKTVKKVQYKKEVAENIQSMPDFSLLNVFTGKKFTKTNLSKQATIFIYFNSTCDYCQHEAESIQQNSNLFKNTQLVFVSDEASEIIEQFAIDYQLNEQANVFFLSDDQNSFSKAFDATSIPYLIIYDKKGNLIERNKGQLKAEAIAEFLNR